MSFAQSDAARLRHATRRLVEEHRLPGIAIGVVQGDDLVYSEGFGYADIESKQPMRPEMRQRIASITKTMVGLCAMALVDEGRLSLADEVPKLLPDIQFKGHVEGLTVWHLLTHTGGIGEAPNIEDLAHPFDKLFSDEPKHLPLAEAYDAGITIETVPGRKWAYANHGYMLLGEIISRIEGADIQDVLHRRVFEPLGMNDSDIRDEPHTDLSTGYHRAPGEDEAELLRRIGQEPPVEETVDGLNIRGKYTYVWDRAAGAVQSTIPDMARYASALLRRGEGIVRAETFEQMVSDQWRPDQRLPGWGLAFAVREYCGHAGFSHGGSAFGGWNSYMAVFPAEKRALLIHMNLMYDRFDTVLVPRIIGAFWDAPVFSPPEARINPRILDSAPGVYEAPSPGPLTNFRIMLNVGRVKIEARDGGLVLASRRGPWKQGFPLVPASAFEQDLFALLTGEPQPPVIAVLRSHGGDVTGLRFPQLADMHRNEDIEPWT
jgi:CubicO group peptidase (beta-lactamase class C family)